MPSVSESDGDRILCVRFANSVSHTTSAVPRVLSTKRSQNCYVVLRKLKSRVRAARNASGGNARVQSRGGMRKGAGGDVRDVGLPWGEGVVDDKGETNDDIVESDDRVFRSYPHRSSGFLGSLVLINAQAGKYQHR